MEPILCSLLEYKQKRPRLSMIEAIAIVIDVLGRFVISVDMLAIILLGE